METKFTPGPWIQVSKDYRVRGNNGEPICDVLQWSHPLQQKSNAHLIAAAPELYAALQSTLLQLCQSSNAHTDYGQEAIGLALAALRHARGEAPHDR